jgi:hypothetical protein
MMTSSLDVEIFRLCLRKTPRRFEPTNEFQRGFLAQAIVLQQIQDSEFLLD